MIDQRDTKESFSAGIFVVDKPPMLTSFAVVAKMRGILGVKKVGHAGTLDPFATGLLVICAGRPATRLVAGFMNGEKEYLATLRLGQETTTLDPEGEIVAEKKVGRLTDATIEACLAQFRGRQMQKPPCYSALKYRGKPLYSYARKGITIEKAPRSIEITTLERPESTACSDSNPYLQLRICCSKGTYIRVLASDIGKELGCGAFLSSLRRIRSGYFSLENALVWDELLSDNAREYCFAKMISVGQIANLLQ